MLESPALMPTAEGSDHRMRPPTEAECGSIRVDLLQDPPHVKDSALRIPPRTVHVWGFDVGSLEDQSEDYQDDLDGKEKSRAAKFAFPKDRRAYVLRHALLRRLVGAYLGVRASRPEFVAGRIGKPALKSAPNRSRLAFSMAASWPIVLFAFASRHELGVDVERIRPIDEAADIAATHFTAQEQRALSAALPADQPRTFFRIWTRKEALVKAIGIGLTADLSSVDVLDRPEPVPHASPSAVKISEDWALADLDLGPGLAAALCLPAGWAIVASPGPD